MNTSSQTSIFPRGQKLSNDWFTGDAFLSPLVARDKNNDFSAGVVSFERSARTNWHTHPKGQSLIVIEGEGYYQERGSAAKAIKKGDTVIIPENTEHWHGASAHSKMTHIAITNYKGDVQVNWLSPVSDEDYRKAGQE